MLEISYAKFCDERFRHTMIALNNCRELDTTTALRVGRICEAADKNKKKIDALEMEIEKKYVHIDEKGIPRRDENGGPMFNAPDAQDKLEAEKAEVLSKTVVQVLVSKIEFAKLAPAKMSGVMLTAIADIVEGLPE